MKTIEHICVALLVVSIVGEIVVILISCFIGVTNLIRSFAMAFGILFLISALLALAISEIENEKTNDTLY